MSSSDTPAETDDAPVARDERRETILALLTDELGDAIVGSHIEPGVDLWVRVTRDAWRDAGLAARDALGFGFFGYLSAIDWLPSPFGRDMEAEQDWAVHGRDIKELPPMTSGLAGGDTRFQVFARVHSIEEGLGITFKADLPDDDLRVASWIPVYAGANWHEREAWEMYGISFDEHPNLAHLYLPGEFEGFPMRKDFPLLARRVKPWPGIVDVEGLPGGADEGDDDE